MSVYQLAQEWKDIFWGTFGWIAVMVDSSLVQVRAYGRCSFSVADPMCLEGQIANPSDVTTYVKTQLMAAFSDTMGERALEVPNARQLTEITPQVIQTLQMKLESKFKAVGLQLNAVSIEKIETG